MHTVKLESANDNEFWHGLPIEKLPSSASEAARNGITFYYTGDECPHGHNAPRYTKGSRCVVCARQHSARQHEYEYKGNNRQSRANMVRAIAACTGNKTYTPENPCKHGHFQRFISSNNCVECDKIARGRRKETQRERRLKKEYGIDLARVDAMLSEQSNRCAICLDEFDTFKNVHVDHCHNTQKVRGILCSKCNQAIGLLRDDREIMLRAIAYIDFHAENKEAA